MKKGITRGKPELSKSFKLKGALFIAVDQNLFTDNVTLYYLLKWRINVNITENPKKGKNT